MPKISVAIKPASSSIDNEETDPETPLVSHDNNETTQQTKGKHPSKVEQLSHTLKLKFGLGDKIDNNVNIVQNLNNVQYVEDDIDNDNNNINIIDDFEINFDEERLRVNSLESVDNDNVDKQISNLVEVDRLLINNNNNDDNNDNGEFFNQDLN